MTQSSRTFRVFVSSTFSDLKEERNALQERVFPKLRDLAASYGCRFQAIDLRWGVSDEAALDQQTMKICLGEIERCQKTSPRPNFIILLGDRYGWQPLPYAIPADEYGLFLPLESQKDQDLLSQWYRRDDNAVPPVYNLLPRRGEYEKFEVWEKVESQLRLVLHEAVDKLSLSPDARLKYFASATEQEIAIGALMVPNAQEHVFGFFREIEGFSENSEANDFHDVDQHAIQMQVELKERLELKLTKNVHKYRARWQNDAPTKDHIDSLCEDVYAELSAVIVSEAKQLDEIDALGHEIENHKIFGIERSRIFFGREDILDGINKYLTSSDPHPLVIWGASGSGKSALMAKAIEKAQKVNPETFYRFIGATPDSSNGRALLEGLCKQISKNYGVDEITIPSDYKDIVQEFYKRLALAKPDKPIILFLDALDQLSDTDHARSLIWLHRELPPNVKLIVSTLPGECFEALDAKVAEQNKIEVQPMSIKDGKTILDTWLGEIHRTLQEDQKAYVLQRFAGCALPLYLKLAFEEARLWKSYKSIPELSADIPGIIRDLFKRLSNESNHGEKLVSHSLGYLAAARNGLSDDEMIDVLSLDEEVLADFNRRSPKSPHMDRLPMVIWSRLFFDLEPYLTERSVDATLLLNFFHASSFRTAITECYPSETEKLKRHQALAVFMEKLWFLPTLHSLHELPYHLQKMQNLKHLAELLTDPRFIRDYCQYFGPFDLLAYSEMCLLKVELQNELTEKLTSINETLIHFCNLLVKEPQTLLQQLYFLINNHWDQSPNMMNWGNEVLRNSKQKVAFSVVEGMDTPKSPLFRDLGIQNDFIPEIKTSPDFSSLYSATFSGQLRCFDMLSGSLIGEHYLSNGNVLSMINLDKNNILLGLTNGTIIKWDGKTESNQIYKVPFDYSVNSLMIKPETRSLYIGPGQWKTHPQSGQLIILNLDSFQKEFECDLNDRIVSFYGEGWYQKRLVNPKGVQINQMIPRPFSSEIAFAFHHGEVSLYDSNNGKWRCVLAINEESVYGLAFNRNGDHLFIAKSIGNNSLGQLIDFNLITWSVQSSIPFHQPLTSLTSNSLTRAIFVGDWSGMVYIIDQTDLIIKESISTEIQGTIRSLCCDSSGRMLAASGRGIQVFIIDEAITPIKNQQEWYWHAMRGHGSGSLENCVFTSLSGGNARCISTKSMEIIYSAPYKYIQCASRASLGIAERVTGGIAIVSLPELKETIAIDLPNLKIVHGLAVDFQGHYAAFMVSQDKNVSILLQKIDNAKSQVESIRNWSVSTRPGLFMPMTFSKDSAFIAAVTSQCSVFPDRNNNQKIEFRPVNLEIFNTLNGIRRTISVESPISSLCFAANGEYLFIGSGTQYEFVDDPGQIFFTEARQTDFQSSTAYSIKLINVKEELEIKTYIGHEGSVNTLSLSSDEKYLCSTSDDHTLRLWDIQSQECLGIIGLFGRPLWVNFTENVNEVKVAYTGWRADKRIIIKIFRFNSI